MGYYDEDFPYRKSRPTKGGGWLQSLFSAIIGGLIVILIMPALIRSGVVNYNLPAPTNNQTITQPAPNTNNNQTIQANVNSEIVNAVDKVRPAVVGVVNIQDQISIFGQTTKNVETGIGSGVIFKKDNVKAYIVTNNHVVEGAKEVEVAVADGKRVKAVLKGTDPLMDLAVLEIDAKDAPAVAEFGTNSTLKVGEPAIAIGNPLGLEFSQTVTVGVISSTERSIPEDIDNDGQVDWEADVLQTDAAINPGNSGGPLVNLAGQVIGINSIKISQSGVEGLGFAIPIDTARPIIDDLLRYGQMKRPYMGITPRDLQTIPTKYWQSDLFLPPDVKEGVVLVNVDNYGPAARAGLEQYDTIVKLDEKQITTSAQLRKYLYYNKKPGDTVSVTYYHGGRLKTATIKLGDMPR